MEESTAEFLVFFPPKLLQVKNPPNTVIHTIADSVKSSLGPTTYPVVRDTGTRPLRHCAWLKPTFSARCEDLVDDVFTATEQEIEDATKFMMERAKQVEPRNEPNKLWFCSSLGVRKLCFSATFVALNTLERHMSAFSGQTSQTSQFKPFDYIYCKTLWNHVRPGQCVRMIVTAWQCCILIILPWRAGGWTWMWSGCGSGHLCAAVPEAGSVNKAWPTLQNPCCAGTPTSREWE